MEKDIRVATQRAKNVNAIPHILSAEKLRMIHMETFE